MVSRFHLPVNLKTGSLSFDGSEFHHMIRVTRHQVGDTIRLFDGSGREADAKITSISRRSATLTIGEVQTLPESDQPQLILAVAMPKSSRAGMLVEKSVELGVARLIPLKTVRSVVAPGQSKLETLRGNIVSACKQCGRSRLMLIDAIADWNDFLRTETRQNVMAVAHPGGTPFTGSLLKRLPFDVEQSPPACGRKNFVIAIGPEGGFTDDEVTRATACGAQLVSLGPGILRVETAALAAAAVFQSAMQEKSA